MISVRLRVCTIVLWCAAIRADYAKDLIASLTLEEKIAQLCIMRINFDDDNELFQYKKELLARYQMGGVIFLHHGTVKKQYDMMREIRSLTHIPLLFMQDAEWGLSMRLTDTPRYPYAMTLGALNDDNLIYEVGRKIGLDCRALGIHVNLSPVVDVNNNPRNPVIHMRSFGDNPYAVARKATAFFKGMQAGGLLVCAKHFPGHGDTTVDSHLGLPFIMHTRKQLDDIELVPFKHVIAEGIDAIMTAHLQVPAIDDRSHRSTSLSYNAVTRLLKQELGFNGLVISDALDMRGVTAYFTPGRLEKEAFIAGTDLFLCCVDIPAALEAIQQAVVNNEITEDEINKRVLKVLRLKERVINPNVLSYEEVMQVIHDHTSKQLRHALYENAMTIAFDNVGMFPLNNDEPIALVYVEDGTPFYETLTQLHACEKFSLSLDASEQDVLELQQKLASYTTIVFSVHTLYHRAPHYGLSEELITFINNCPRRKALVLFGSPYALSLFKNIDAALVAYENDEEAQRAAARVITGKLQAHGILPVNVF